MVDTQRSLSLYNLFFFPKTWNFHLSIIIRKIRKFNSWRIKDHLFLPTGCNFKSSELHSTGFTNSPPTSHLPPHCIAFHQSQDRLCNRIWQCMQCLSQQMINDFSFGLLTNMQKIPLMSCYLHRYRLI